MISAEQIAAAHADLVAVGMSPETHSLAATSLARWRAMGDNAQCCEIFLTGFGLPAAAIHKLMFGESIDS